MKRGVSAQGICGIAMQPSYPVGAPMPGPNAGPCKSSEEAVQIQGVAGRYCAPKCSSSSPCSTNYPSGVSGATKGECVVESPGSGSPDLCALICDPSSSSGCPDKASCKPIQGLGLCTYDS